MDGVAYRGPISQSEFLRRAMAELRSAGTACESFAVDNNIYPGPVEPIDSFTRVESDLEPLYIRNLPIIDPWGHPYWFWSNTRAYGLVSYGSDGLPDYPYAAWGVADFESLHTGTTSQVGGDVVFVDGQFAQWPAFLTP